MTHDEVVMMIDGLKNGQSWREVPHDTSEPSGLPANLLSHLATCEEERCKGMREKRERAVKFCATLYGTNEYNNFWGTVAASLLFFISTE